jgi:hypothetical protein
LLQDYAEKYANMLTGRDVSRLFDHLKSITSRSEAARICDLERRTTFYWDGNKEIKLQTKKQVLQALLEKDYLFTLNYLCERSFEISSETIDLYLKSIYENAMNADIAIEDFRKLFYTFYESRIKFSPLINSSMTDVVSDLLKNLDEQALLLNIPLPKMPLSIMNAEEMVEKLPFVIKMLPSQISESNFNYLEKQLNLPLDFIKFASHVRTEACLIEHPKIPIIENTALNPSNSLMYPISATDTANSLKYIGLMKTVNEGASSIEGLTMVNTVSYIS